MARRKGNLTLAKEAGDGARCKRQLVVTSEDNIMKKRKVVVASSCGACGGKPKLDGQDCGKAWQEYVIVGVRRQPVGPVCEECFQCHRSLFSYMPLAQWLESLADDDSHVSKQLKKAREVKRGRALALDAEEVNVVHQTGCRVYTPIVTFTAYGYEQHFREKASQSQDKATLMSPKLDGTGFEKLWVFSRHESDPCPPHGKIGHMWSDTVVEQRVVKMPHAECAYPDQGLKYFGHSISSDKSSNVRFKRLLTVDQEKRALARKTPKSAKAVGGDDAEFHDSDVEVEVVTALAGEPGGPSDFGQAAQRSAAAKFDFPASKANTGRGTMDGASPSAGGYGTTGWGGVVPLHMSPCAKSSFTEGAESHTGVSRGLESDNDAVDEDSDESDDDTVESMVHKKIRALDLTMIMSGHRRGNQLRRASELIDKLNPSTDAAPLSQLKTHLSLVTKAMCLTPKKIVTLTDSELQRDAADLEGARVQLTSAVQQEIVSRRAKAYAGALKANPSHDNFQMMLKLFTPWGGGGQQRFDVTDPRMASVDLPLSKKLQLFESLVCSHVIVGMVHEGEAGGGALCSFAKMCCTSLETVDDSIDLSDQVVASIHDSLTTWRCLTALLDHTTDFESQAEELYETAVKAVSDAARMTRSRNIKAKVGAILANNPYYKGLLAAYFSTRAHSKTAAQDLASARATLSSLEVGSVDADAALQCLVGKAIAWRRNLRNGAHTPVTDLIVNKVSAHIRASIKNLVGDVDGEDSPKRFDALATMLQDVLSFAATVDTNTLKTELEQASKGSSDARKLKQLEAVIRSIATLDLSALGERSCELIQVLTAVAGANVDAALKESLTKNLENLISKLMDGLSSDYASSVQEVASKLSHFISEGAPTTQGSVCFGVMSRARDILNDCSTIAGIVANVDSWGSDGMPMYTVEAAATTLIVHKAAYTQVIESWVTQEAWAGAIVAKSHDIFAKGHAALTDIVGRIMSKRTASVNQLLGDLEPKAGGCSDGRSWCHDLPLEATFDDYFAQAKETLIGAGNEGHLIKQCTDQLVKERATIIT